MELYSSPVSPNGKRVRICAAELGISLDTVNLDFRQGEQRAPAYLTMNPMGKVPTLKDGDFALWESAAILAYLAQVNGSPLWPTEPRTQADLLRWLFFGASHLDPHFTTLVVERFIKARQSLPEDEKLTAAAVETLTRFVPVLEAQIARHEFVTGSFGLADIALGCTLELSPMLRFDLGAYPAVQAWLARLQARPSWQAASQL